jgi:hypothetical protein
VGAVPHFELIVEAIVQVAMEFKCEMLFRRRLATQSLPEKL